MIENVSQEKAEALALKRPPSTTAPAPAVTEHDLQMREIRALLDDLTHRRHRISTMERFPAHYKKHVAYLLSYVDKLEGQLRQAPPPGGSTCAPTQKGATKAPTPNPSGPPRRKPGRPKKVREPAPAAPPEEPAWDAAAGPPHAQEAQT